MNALLEIQNKAKIIVEQLADKEVNRMEELYNEFATWANEPDNAIMDRYKGGIDTYNSVEKYVYMTQYKKWDYELNQFVSPTTFPEAYRERRQMYFNKNLVNMVEEIRLVANNKVEQYREAFIGANMVKLNRALAKYITNEMTAKNIRVSVGGDGAEVIANVDGKVFKTFGTLCGGWVQCYHYRYRSSLK